MQKRQSGYEALVEKALRRGGALEEVELLRTENQLLRERAALQERRVEEMVQEVGALEKTVAELDLNRDEGAKEYMRQLVGLLAEQGLDEGLSIESVRVQDLFARVVKLIAGLKDEVHRQFQDINDAQLALS